MTELEMIKEWEEAGASQPFAEWKQIDSETRAKQREKRQWQNQMIREASKLRVNDILPCEFTDLDYMALNEETRMELMMMLPRGYKMVDGEWSLPWRLAFYLMCIALGCLIFKVFLWGVVW